MPLLSASEALCVSDSFLSSLYGDDVFRMWKQLKDEMKFSTEREYVGWLIDVANHYKSEDIAMTEEISLVADSDTIVVSEYGMETLKREEDQNKGNQQALQSSYRAQSKKRKCVSDIKTEPSGSENHFTVPKEINQFHLQNLDTDDYGNCYNEKIEEPRMVNVESGEEIILSQLDESEVIEQASVEIDDTRNAKHNDEDGEKSMKIFSCPYCSYTSQYSVCVTRHVSNEHESLNAFSSPTTNEIEERPSGSGRTGDTGEGTNYEEENHSASHIHESVTYFGECKAAQLSCTYCQYRSNNSGHVKRHIDTVHKRIKGFSCDYCTYQAGQKVTLQRHLVKRHGFHISSIL